MTKCLWGVRIMQIHHLASGLMFPEGPAIGPDGMLYVTEIAGQRISQISDTGIVTTFAETGGGPNGAAFDGVGNLLVCNNGGRWPTDKSSTEDAGPVENGPGRIQTISASGTVNDTLFEIDGVPLNAPNDLCFDGYGGFYFTDPIWSGLVGGERDGGPVCYVDANGTATRVAGGIGFPNGLGVRDDGRVLVVCESLTGMLLSFQIEAPGVLSSASKANGMIGRRSVPDGFCFDASGRIIVAGHGSNNLFVLDGRDGRPIEVIELPEPGATNCCFGGTDFKTLYVTSSDYGNVYAIDWPVEGMQLFHNR
ncbi:MAG: SMP-30/gluconolactonase/LRE family protein [Actinomycetota bacterium]|nr:SMP-30/gluconolactonase/LRE family protein [Acidimicrobiales bacterium]